MATNPELLVEALLNLAIAEDIGDGDHSTLSCIPPSATGKVQLMMKQEGIIAGLSVALKIFKKIDSSVEVEFFRGDGDLLRYGDIAFKAEGKVHSLLQAERLILNVLQRMSGVATQTREYVNRCEGTKAKILDTRKTTPGMRILDKMAVVIGGGMNHRMGLFDMIMLKDNHIDFAGGIENAVALAHKYLNETGRKLAVEVEARSLKDVQVILRVGGVNRIMLDNFSVEATREAVGMIGGRVETESSGGITLENIRDYALCGVDFISVGALTHQIRSIDMNLKKI